MHPIRCLIIDSGAKFYPLVGLSHCTTASRASRNTAIHEYIGAPVKAKSKIVNCQQKYIPLHLPICLSSGFEQGCLNLKEQSEP